jgi:hypothetical protein
MRREERMVYCTGKRRRNTTICLLVCGWLVHSLVLLPQYNLSPTYCVDVDVGVGVDVGVDGVRQQQLIA